jgi:hypothetical protein
MVEKDRTYDATVASACLTCSSKGTPGLAMTYTTGSGDIEDTIWLTSGTIERAKKTLGMLGADTNKLASRDYMETVGNVISGAECEIVTEWDDYGKGRVRVKWVNARKGANVSGGNLSARVAHLFGGPEPESDEFALPF